MFTKEPTLKEKSRAWMSNLKKEQRNLDRDMQKMEKEESKLKVEIKKSCSKEPESCMPNSSQGHCQVAKDQISTSRYQN